MKKERIVLQLDTSSNEYINICLIVDGKEFCKNEKYGKTRSQIVLPLLHTLLEEHTTSLRDLNEISVHTGPGSFTGLRVGVSIANTLGNYLKIPINKQPVGKLVEPEYT